jgi:hypothetical protein
MNEAWIIPAIIAFGFLAALILHGLPDDTTKY